MKIRPFFILSSFTIIYLANKTKILSFILKYQIQYTNFILSLTIKHFSMKNVFKKLLFIGGGIIFLLSCRKEHALQTSEIPNIRKAKIHLPTVTNPFSIRNIAKAKVSLSAKAKNSNTNRTSGDEEQFIYFRFNPQQLTTEQFQTIENDNSVVLMEIPFANMAIYSDEFALDEAKAEELKDEFVYGITSIENVNALSAFASNAETETQYLDTLVKVAETDTTLQYQAFREAGATEETINRFRICLLKRPHGFVNYWDNQKNSWERVRGMQVWSLFLGIPITTYSDDNGYYEIPWRYSIGTIMGTKAKNNRVNVKPLDTHGTFIRNLYTLVTQFIVGSVHIEGWVTPCQMRDGKDFNFGGHTQVRYWSQLLNAYYFHDKYCENEGIDKAPPSMVCYAQWANTQKCTIQHSSWTCTDLVDEDRVPDFGNASTPMLGHIPNSPLSLITQYFEGVLNGENITNYPNLFNLVFGLLPDMTIRVPEASEPQFYNSRLCQTAMHELSHASHYQRVGNWWWTNFIKTTLGASSVSGNPYGDKSRFTDVGESWAEFLGTNFAMRRYDSLQAIKQATADVFPFSVNHYYRMDQLLENETWFYGGRWIPYGCYHDFMDNTNLAPNNANETWDAIQGVSIRQLFDAQGNKITSMCEYRENFIFQNPGLNRQSINDIFIEHNVLCP